MSVILLNKPFGVLCQFTDRAGRPTLADFVRVRDVYPAGRLDHDSEGLLVLTDDGALQARLADPRHHVEKTYWAQVEGEPTPEALGRLRRGITLKDGRTRPARVRLIAEPPGLWPREPPIRRRVAIPTAWLEIGLREGDLAFLHVHPDADRLRFGATFPTPGRYRLFLQFKVDGRVHTAAFTQEVSP